MSNRNKKNRNHWDDRGNDFRDEDRNRNWDRESRRNTSMHQGNRDEDRQSSGGNYGLSDTSQGSTNYGHIDDGTGARFYGTGSYGGYIGGGSDNDSDRRHHEDRRRNEGRSEYFEDKNLNSGSYGNNDRRSYNSGNYERGPRYGNSNIHDRSYGRGNDGQGRNNDRDAGYITGRSSDWNQDRDWWDKTTDEVSSWFGDEDANRRRELDQRSGPHQGKGPKGYTRTDEKIKENVEERLYHDSFIDASDIEVSVHDGEVTLSGSVDNKQTRRRAEDCADAVAGVKDVSLNLKVNRTSGYDSSSEIGSLNSRNSGTLTEKDQKSDQSNDLNRTENK